MPELSERRFALLLSASAATWLAGSVFVDSAPKQFPTSSSSSIRRRCGDDDSMKEAFQLFSAAEEAKRDPAKQADFRSMFGKQMSSSGYRPSDPVQEGLNEVFGAFDAWYAWRMSGSARQDAEDVLGRLQRSTGPLKQAWRLASSAGDDDYKDRLGAAYLRFPVFYAQLKTRHPEVLRAELASMCLDFLKIYSGSRLVQSWKEGGHLPYADPAAWPYDGDD